MITADKIQFTDPMKYQKLFEKMHEDIATAFQKGAGISVEEKSEPRQSKRKKIEEIPIWEKSNLTIQEALCTLLKLFLVSKLCLQQKRL